jgi:hypothetical protein
MFLLNQAMFLLLRQKHRLYNQSIAVTPCCAQCKAAAVAGNVDTGILNCQSFTKKTKLRRLIAHNHKQFTLETGEISSNKKKVPHVVPKNWVLGT